MAFLFCLNVVGKRLDRVGQHRRERC
jgi:hypothetical protein